MLSLPEAGLQRSVTKHNTRLDVLSDWVEATILFDESRLSVSDVSDLLLENNIYAEQDFASERLEATWEQLRRRQNWIGASRTLDVHGRYVERVSEWRDVPAHSFCLAVALREVYAEYSASIGEDYTEQGELFERITAESLSTLGWQTHITGWSGIGVRRAFADVLTDIADRLNEPAAPNNAPVSLRSIKDHGTDVLCYLPFTDRRGGYPTFLIQCASGQHWQRKLRAPSLRWWESRIGFSHKPARGIAIPYTFSDDSEFREQRLDEEGLFLDRYRLLSAGYEHRDWLSATLHRDLVDWLEKHLPSLPKLPI